MVDHELAAMIANDERHWWYRGRRRVMRAVLDRLRLPESCRLLDAGCGSGRMLDELRGYGDAVGLEVSELAVSVARAHGHRVLHGSVEAAPFVDACFDVVTCLDVVEHTPDERQTFRELCRITRPGGLLVVTVPAYQALWSVHDEANLHYRRYSAGSLRAAAGAEGWTLVRDSYFNSVLLAPAAAVRLIRRGREPAAGESDLGLTPRWLNGTLELPLHLEAALIGRGVRIPSGLSVLAVFTRPALGVIQPRPDPPAPRNVAGAEAAVRGLAAGA